MQIGDRLFDLKPARGAEHAVVELIVLGSRGLLAGAAYRTAAAARVLRAFELQVAGIGHSMPVYRANRSPRPAQRIPPALRISETRRRCTSSGAASMRVGARRVLRERLRSRSSGSRCPRKCYRLLEARQWGRLPRLREPRARP